jgi:hypothetical protein
VVLFISISAKKLTHRDKGERVTPQQHNKKAGCQQSEEVLSRITGSTGSCGDQIVETVAF